VASPWGGTCGRIIHALPGIRTTRWCAKGRDRHTNWIPQLFSRGQWPVAPRRVTAIKRGDPPVRSFSTCPASSRPNAGPSSVPKKGNTRHGPGLNSRPTRRQDHALTGQSLVVGPNRGVGRSENTKSTVAYRMPRRARLRYGGRSSGNSRRLRDCGTWHRPGLRCASCAPTGISGLRR
jgi:hypothetical protein